MINPCSNVTMNRFINEGEAIYDAGTSIIIAKRKETEEASNETRDTVIKSMMSIVSEDEPTAVMKSLISMESPNGVVLTDDYFIFQTFQNISDYELSLQLANFEANLLSKKECPTHI